MSCVSVSTEQTSASLTLNNGTATIVVSPCNFGDGAVVTATGLGRSVLGANNQSTAPGQFVLELLVGSRGVAVRGRSEPTVTPDYKGVARRETAKKIRAEFFDCTLLLGVTLEFPSSGTTGLHSSLQGRGCGDPSSYVALVVVNCLRGAAGQGVDDRLQIQALLELALSFSVVQPTTVKLPLFVRQTEH